MNNNEFDKEILIREMSMSDFDEVHALWESIKNFAMRSVDDSREGVERFLARNPHTSVVASVDGKIVGTILCGHDGRTGCFYHVCVHNDYRRHGIGKMMVVHCMEKLREEKVSKISLNAFKNNDGGNAFWQQVGWKKREDFNTYEFVLNEENIIAFNK